MTGHGKSRLSRVFLGHGSGRGHETRQTVRGDPIGYLRVMVGVSYFSHA